MAKTNEKEENHEITTNSIEISEPKKKLPTHKWAIATYILGIVFILFIVGYVMGNVQITGKVIGQSTMKDKIDAFVNTELVPEGGVTIESITKESGVYVATVSTNGQTVPLYFTLDGKFISPGRDLYSIVKSDSNTTDTTDTSSSTPKNVTKSDKPAAELFVMTYCPYGTQAEKGIIPAIEALGSSGNVKIRFVHYFMHGDKEEQETYTQICIREEQKDKFLPYLKCFLNASDSTGCLASTGVDTTSLKSCIADRAKKYYEGDSELSKKYGVQGSPTLIVNGGDAEFYPRSPATALSIICNAYNKAPSVCSTAKLSSENPSPGFGYTASATAGTDATCG